MISLTESIRNALNILSEADWDEGKYRDKLVSTWKLATAGATEGEKQAGMNAFNRLLNAMREKYGDKAAESAEKYAKGSSSSSGSSSSRSRYQSKPKDKPKPKPEPKADPFGNQASSGGGEYTDRDTGWTFTILRYTNPSAGKRGSDKIWGYAERDGEYMTFWGAYGKTLRDKPVSYNEAMKKFNEKLGKGYKKTAVDPIDYGYLFTQAKTW